MNRRQPLILITDGPTVASGLMPDRHVLFTPLWATAENVQFYQGKVRRLVPAAEAFETIAAAPMRGLHQQQVSDGTRWVMAASFVAGSLKFHRWYGPAPELIATIPTAHQDQIATTPATYADFTTWGDWTVLNTSIGPAKLYKPGVSLANLANAPTDAVSFMKKQNQILALGWGLNRKNVGWSDADDIENWDFESTTTIAGQLAIEELDTGIRATARLGSYIACYAEDQLAIVSWIGSPFYYGQRVALDGIGAVGKLAVCSDSRSNYGVGRNGIWRTDGTSQEYIDAGSLRDYLQENVNWDQSSKIIAFRNDVNQCFEFHFPMHEELECTEGWAYDPGTGGWSKVPAFQVLMERRILDKPIAASAGIVSMLDENMDAEAVLDLRTKPMLVQTDNGALHQGAIIDEIEIALKTAENVEFRYCTAENIDSERHEAEWQSLSADLRTYQLEVGPTGTFHWLEFRSTQANWDFDLHGFALFGEPAGTKRERL